MQHRTLSPLATPRRGVARPLIGRAWPRSQTALTASRPSQVARPRRSRTVDQRRRGRRGVAPLGLSPAPRRPPITLCADAAAHPTPPLWTLRTGTEKPPTPPPACEAPRKGGGRWGVGESEGGVGERRPAAGTDRHGASTHGSLGVGAERARPPVLEQPRRLRRRRRSTGCCSCGASGRKSRRRPPPSPAQSPPPSTRRPPAGARTPKPRPTWTAHDGEPPAAAEGFGTGGGQGGGRKSAAAPRRGAGTVRRPTHHARGTALVQLVRGGGGRRAGRQ